MITRRFLLAAAAATSASAVAAKLAPMTAIPTVPAPPAPKAVAWVVGTPGEYDWETIRAATREEAIRGWLDSTDWEPECEIECPPGADPETWEPELLRECVCGNCPVPDLEAKRVPSFDDIRRPTPGDWIRAGIGHTCSRCHEETGPDTGATDIGDECVCDDCMTPDERKADIEAAEARANIRLPLHVIRDRMREGAGDKEARRALRNALDDLSRSAHASGVALRASLDGDAISLDHIERTTAEKGAGAPIMSQVCAIADQTGLTVRLYASGAEPKLTAYYGLFGFRADPESRDEAMLRRLPKPDAQSQSEETPC